MSSPLQSLIGTGTKLWLDSIDPELVTASQKQGATGATSNPIIVSNIIKSGRYDDQIRSFKKEGLDAESIAWKLTNQLVTDAEKVFLATWEETKGDDGYVSFEVDPLLEDTGCTLSLEEKKKAYVEQALKWAEGHPNRLIKVPATEAGLAALEDMVAQGVNVNVTLIFSERQYNIARDAVWRGAQKRSDLNTFKSVYSIFVSRLDVYAENNFPELSEDAQSNVGILNAKRVWQKNTQFWAEQKTPLKQEMIFASTGTKKPSDPAWKYVAAFAGSDIETNPPATNDAVNASEQQFTKQIDKMPDDSVVAEIDKHLDWDLLEKTLMSEGLEKFAEPQKALLDLIAST
jgi:transaldolase